MRIFYLLICLLFTLSITAQTNNCGFIQSAEQRDAVRKVIESQTTIDGQNGFNSIPVAFHFFIRDDSTGGYFDGLQDTILNRMNRNFASANLHFYTCEETNLVYSDEFYDYNTSQFSDMLWLGYRQNKLNIHLFGSINGGSLCGIYQGTNSVQIAYPCAQDAGTVEHEIGHFLLLGHTFGSNSSHTDELADGSNCESTGDFICDTPADPNRLDMITNQCIWHGTEEDDLGYPDTLRDANGDAYNPDVHNLMSYYRIHSCRNRFSPQQGDLMNGKITEGLKFYYRCTDYFIDFNVSVEQVTCDGMTSVSVSPNIIDPDLQYFWDVDDDGNVDYTSPTFEHTYLEEGKYTIALEVYFPERNNSLYRTKYEIVQVSNVAVEAPFLSDFEEGVFDSFVTVQSGGLFDWEIFTLIDDNHVGYFVATPEDQGFLEFNVDLSGMEMPILEFDYAYHNGASPGDSLSVEMLNCTTDEYSTVFLKGGDELHTLPTNGHPTAQSDWGYASISLEAYKGQKARIKFRGLSDEAGFYAMFLDNVLVREDASSSVIDGSSISASVNLIPNPVSDHLVIESSKNIDEYYISDVRGQEMNRGKESSSIDVSTLSRGVYFITVLIDGNLVTKRFVKL